MADVTITIRKSTAGADTTIMVSGSVDDTSLAPFTSQLSDLLSAAAHSPSVSAVPSTSPSAS